MPTSGSYFNPDECPYQPRMTRAAALALRAAGGLKENCVVVITDGPTIGTAGNTSPTEIELNPVSATEFGTAARVNTTFDNSAWSGEYDIDLGAAGSIVELRSANGNVGKDTDANSPTVHTQIPWHLTGAAFRDNYIEDSTLTGFPGTGNFTNNRVIESTLNFTGKTAGTVDQSIFQGSTLTSGAASLTATRLEMFGSTVSNAGTGPLTFTGVEIDQTPNALVLQATDTQGATLTSNHILGGFRINLARTGGGVALFTGNIFQGLTADPIGDFRALGTGGILVQTSHFHARITGGANSMFILDGSGSTTIRDSTFHGAAGLSAPGGFVKDVASTGTLTIDDSEILIGILRLNSTGNINIIAGCYLTSGSLIHNGSGILTLQGLFNTAGSVTMGVGSTRGLTLGSGYMANMTIVQNGTGGAAVDNFIQGINLYKSTITLGFVTAATHNLQGLLMEGATLTGAGAPGVATVVNNCVIATQATLNIQAGSGAMQGVRLGSGAVLNTGAFAATNSILEGAITHTQTAANTNKLGNKAFNDWV